MLALPTWQARPVPVGGLPGCAGLRTGITPEGQKNAELGGSRGWGSFLGRKGATFLLPLLLVGSLFLLFLAGGPWARS